MKPARFISCVYFDQLNKEQKHHLRGNYVQLQSDAFLFEFMRQQFEYSGYAFFFNVKEVDRVMDMIKVMCVRISNDAAIPKIRMLRTQRV